MKRGGCWWPTTRRRGALLGVILLIGAALRLWLWWRTPIHQPANDEIEYLAVARDLLAGHGWQFYTRYHWLRAPLYPLWLAASLSLVGGDLRWAALPNIALSTVTVYLFYLLGREVGASSDDHDCRKAERTGLLAAGVAALLLTLSTFASLWMSETLFTALFVAALLALLRCADRPRLWLAGVAGVLLGLAILTRSLPLTLLPFAALWLGWQVWNRMRAQVKRGIAHAVVFGLLCIATIAPWTLRNYLAYGAFIPVETGLSYNLWAFNEPREDDATIFKTLASIPNPVDRAAYATAKGLARLREDPAILLRKLWPGWSALWRVKPIEDRFLQRTYYQDVPIGMFATALALDDALYAIVAVLGGAALLLAPLDRRKVLLGGWFAYVIAVVLLTHGEGRYRHFIFPVLVPYAAWLATNRSAWRFRSARLWASFAITIGLLWSPLILQYDWAWAERNVARGWYVQRAEWAARSGDTAAAITLYGRAGSADPGSADVWLGLGQLYQRLGQEPQALDAFNRAFANMPSYVAVNVRRGDALRRLGRDSEAADAFKGFYTSEADMVEWAWNELDTPPPSVLTVGDGLDYGFVQGVYAAETYTNRKARWTAGRAELKLAGSRGAGGVQLTLAAPRADRAPAPVRICVNTRCADVIVQAEWRSFTLTVSPADRYNVTISAPTFQPQQFNARSPDTRDLGVLLDEARVISS